MTKHTPGPWAASRDASVIFKGHATIAHIEPAFDPETDSDTPDVTAANARLIAAAPDMLTKAKALVEAMEVPRSRKGGEAYFAMWDVIRAVEGANA